MLRKDKNKVAPMELFKKLSFIAFYRQITPDGANSEKFKILFSTVGAPYL